MRSQLGGQLAPRYILDVVCGRDPFRRQSIQGALTSQALTSMGAKAYRRKSAAPINALDEQHAIFVVRIENQDLSR
jgi:hypothetical protein